MVGTLWATSQDFKGTVTGSGETLTVDETALLSSKAPKATPVFTGVVTVPMLKTASGTTASLAQNATENIFTASGFGVYLLTVIGDGNDLWRGEKLIRSAQNGLEIISIGTDQYLGVGSTGAVIYVQNLHPLAMSFRWSYITLSPW